MQCNDIVHVNEISEPSNHRAPRGLNELLSSVDFLCLEK